ncbi:MAG: ABC transporter ATP-binding protein [Candidatus Marinimicrobia bacterium]|nr:ABC transporter ATP-binding protein [Candidatus Neomarinimicrobiota bacterium]
MNDQKINFKRIIEFIKPESLFMSISLANGLFFVIFNSISIWLTASLINNVLIDFDQLVLDQEKLLASESPGLNERIKIAVNDFILRDTNIETLKVLCLTIILIFVLKNIFLYLKNLSMSYVQLRIVTHLRNRIYAHLQTLSLSFFHRRKSGDLSSVVIHDVSMLNRSIGTTFQKIIVEPINILAFTILLFIISWKLMLVAIFIIPFSQFVIQKIGKSIRRKARRNTKQIGGILSIITENLSTTRIVKAFSMEKNEVKRFDQESWKYFGLLFRSSKLRLLSSPIIETIGVSMAVILLWLGGSEVMIGSTLSSEDFLRFMFLLFSMLGPVRSLSNVHITLQNGYASAERIFEILDEQTEVVDSGQFEIKTLDQDLKFENVDFDYGEGSFQLNNVSFQACKGETIAFVGASGAGKSTIADLIPRFYDVNEGRIIIDGKDIREYKIDSLRQMMGIVTQETILLNTSIRNNITYGSESIDEKKLIEAARGANAVEFIDNLEEKYETAIGERGVKLSGGQQQRIAIARAIYKNPSLLLLDEATSALDTRSERLVQNALDNLMENRTVLVIAHRLSTIKNADKIIVMDMGKIVEIGTHDELYNVDGIYHRLYNIQFEN